MIHRLTFPILRPLAIYCIALAGMHAADPATGSAVSATDSVATLAADSATSANADSATGAVPLAAQKAAIRAFFAQAKIDPAAVESLIAGMETDRVARETMLQAMQVQTDAHKADADDQAAWDARWKQDSVRLQQELADSQRAQDALDAQRKEIEAELAKADAAMAAAEKAASAAALAGQPEAATAASAASTTF